MKSGRASSVATWQAANVNATVDEHESYVATFEAILSLFTDINVPPSTKRLKALQSRDRSWCNINVQPTEPKAATGGIGIVSKNVINQVPLN